MLTTTDKVKRLLARYGNAATACWAIEDRAIRCKSAVCEARLFYLAEAVDIYARLNGAS